MSIGELCNRDVQIIKRDEPLANAARVMIEHDIGALIVVESRDLLAYPVGVLTDRDIICGQLARSADLHCLNVADVMSPNPVTVPESTGIDEAIETLSAHGVRRAPVVTNRGDLVGVISFDDLFPVVARDLDSLAQLMGLHKRELPVAPLSAP